MASSPPSSSLANSATSASGSDRAFALQELHACWQQAYEALARDDLGLATSLMDMADEHVRAAGEAADDSPEEAQLRKDASTTYGLLHHAMTTGISVIKSELARARKGAKALRGYDPGSNTGGRLVRDA